MMQEHQERVWSLMAKKIAGEASPDELQELERLLQGNPDLHSPARVITEWWNQEAPIDRQDVEEAFDRHLDRMRGIGIEQHPFPMPGNRFGKRHWKAWVGAAAVAALALGIIFALQYTASHAPAADRAAGTIKGDNEISTRNGSKTHLVLPDGTLVWLNAGSRIVYDKNFGANLREVSLTGEAFFDVARNAEKPFLIHTARIDIKVLGTRFNVRSYPTDETTEATLIRGSIEVSIKDRPSEKIILKPNEKLVVANDDSTLHRNVVGHSGVNAGESLVNIRKPTYEPVTGEIVETSWVDNKLIFQDENFGDLAARMERWYGVEIHFADPALKEMRFTGSFQKETIQQALDALKLAADFYYKIDGDRVNIYEKR